MTIEVDKTSVIAKIATIDLSVFKVRNYPENIKE